MGKSQTQLTCTVARVKNNLLVSPDSFNTIGRITSRQPLLKAEATSHTCKLSSSQQDNGIPLPLTNSW